MRAYRIFALWTTAATYFLVFAGALVRVSGAGLGCPDWPKCFGRWIPPTSLDQLPAGIDPATFNVTLAWIEYFNRLAGVTVGFLILGVALLALRYFRKKPRVLYPSLAAALLVAFQGWQGSQVVASGLEPYIVTIHMGLALIIASLLIYATLESFSVSSSPSSLAEFPKHTRLLVVWLWVVTILQIILGSQVRQGLETAARQNSHGTPNDWFSSIGVLDDLHVIFGVLAGLLMLYTGLAVLHTDGRTVIIRQTVWGLLVLVILQALSGLVLLMSGLPALTDLYHLWFASLFLGLLLVLLGIVRRPRVLDSQWQGSFRRLSAIVLAVVVIMGLVSWWVIDQARDSTQPAQSVIGALLPSVQEGPS